MSLVRFKAKNHPQQAVVDDVDDRRTPPELFAREHAAHRFTVDAAASAANALLPRFWTRVDDGLAQCWAGERVWCNPPYSSIAPWVRKAHESVDVPMIVMLLPANRTEQRWWQDDVEPYRDRGGGWLTTSFLRGRLRFGHAATWITPKKGDRPPFGLVLLTWSRPSMAETMRGT